MTRYLLELSLSNFSLFLPFKEITWLESRSVLPLITCTFSKCLAFFFLDYDRVSVCCISYLFIKYLYVESLHWIILIKYKHFCNLCEIMYIVNTCYEFLWHLVLIVFFHQLKTCNSKIIISKIVTSTPFDILWYPISSYFLTTLTKLFENCMASMRHIHVHTQTHTHIPIFYNSEGLITSRK